MKLALAPLNPTVGDLTGNADLAIRAIAAARAEHADLIVLPELAISGYPPKDLLHQSGFVEAAMKQAALIANSTKDIVAFVGCPWRADTANSVHNSVVVMHDGAIADRYDKRLLPTYDVFDEDRYFTSGDRPLVIDIAGRRVGIAICEDLWGGQDAGAASRYRHRPDPVADLAAAGADVIVAPSASPFVLGKSHVQREILHAHARRHSVTLASVNQFGANDDLIFDGHAAIVAPNSPRQSRLAAANASFTGDALILDLESIPSSASADPTEPSDDALLWRALTLGVRDYARKTGFKNVVLGLSGGLDSALTACLATAALGADHVLTVGMPSRYSSPGSITDAEALARRIGTRFIVTPINALHDAAERETQRVFDHLTNLCSVDVAHENIQSRLRGLILMAISNATGALLLSTGNKSELAVGYCTLYGDMNGGLAPLADVTKTRLYRLATWLNAHFKECGFSEPPIPQSTIQKAPSAELRPNQTDQDTLPPYEQLDEIITRFVEDRDPPDIIAQTGLDPALVARVIRLIQISEHKRKQSTVGLKVSRVAFGPGRRFPIAQGWRAALE